MDTMKPMTALVALVAASLSLAAPAGAALKKSFIPLPEILTDPNEGNTYGFLQVVLFLDEQKIIKYILAPDVRYNKITGVYPTFRLFGYPSIDAKWSIVLRKSESIDEDYDLRYQDNAFWQDRLRLFANLEYSKDSTERFFGFGNGSSQKDESNFTAEETSAIVRLAYRLQPTIELTYRARLRVFRVGEGGIDRCAPGACGSGELPFITDEHPETVGHTDGTIVGQEFGLLYDTRDDTSIPRQGGLGFVSAEVIPRALGSSISVVKYALEARKFIPLRDRFVLAMHTRFDYIQGDGNVPFFEQNDIGGRSTLRGFGSGRFVDKDRFFASVELRTRVYRREIFGVNADLELAPFVDFGEVFRSSRNSPFNDLHAVGGLGFRGVVRPQVVGFVDIGFGEQGLAAFTGLEYPF
jgi:outer membrane protein assembly factor BamA